MSEELLRLDEPYGWHDFPTESPGGDGVRVELQQNGWLALIAFAAGPRHVFAVPAVRRAVRVTVTSGGPQHDEPSRRRRVTTMPSTTR